MNATHQVLFGSAVLTVFSIIAGVIAYGTKLVLVRNLTVEEYGLFFSVLTLIFVLQIFTSLGLSSGLSRSIAKLRVHSEFSKIKSIIIGSFAIKMSMAILVMIILFVLSDWLAATYFENKQAQFLIVILSLYFPLNVLKSQFESLFNGFSKSFYLSLIQFLYNLSIFIIVIVGFYFFSGISVPTVAYLGAFIIVVLVLLVPLFKTFNMFKFTCSNFKESNKELLIFSFPLIFTAIGATLLSYFDTLMLTYYDTLVEVGVYNIVYPTALLLVLIGSSIGVALLPVITRLFEEGKKDIISHAFSKIYVYVGFVIIPAIVILILLSEYIIEIFFGEEYLLGLIVFNVLAFGSLFKIFFAIHNKALIAIGRPVFIFWVYVFGAVSNVVLNLFLIPLYSLTGAGVATVLSFMLMFGVSFIMLRREVGLVFPISKFLMIVLCSLSIVISVHIFWLLSFNIYVLTALGLIVGAGLYIGLVLIFRIIDVIEFFKMFGIDIEDVFEKMMRRLL